MFESTLQEYESAVHKITVIFAHKYFGNDYHYNTGDWVNLVVGGCVHINDYYFQFDEILQYLKYRYTKKQMFEYYDYDLDMRNKGKSPICIRDWKKLKKQGIIKIPTK